MKNTITFSVPSSPTLHTLPLGDTLVRFVESDFSYFWEQCISAAARALRGDYPSGRVLLLRELLRDCHPYVRCLLDSDFSQVALDCIIDYVCMSEGVGLEELWVKYLSATDEFGRAVFDRISEYKSARAINQWTNLLRMQSYCASKLSFIYGGEDEGYNAYKVRSLYYDSAFRMCASELGCDEGKMPGVTLSSLPFVKRSPEIMKNAVPAVLPQVKAMVGGRKAHAITSGADCLQDQNAGMAINALMNLGRPSMNDMRQFLKLAERWPGEVYTPSCFKAVIDLEFDVLMERGYYLQLSEASGSWVVKLWTDDGGVEQKPYDYEEAELAARKLEEAERLAAEAEKLTEKLQQAEKAAAERAEKAQKAAETEKPAEPEKAAVPEKAEKPEKTEKTAAKSAKKAAKAAKPAGDAGSSGEGLERARLVRELADDKSRETSGRTLQEVNSRCQLICSGMHVRIGWNVTTEEIREWFRHLIYIRRCIGTGEMTAEDLERYLEATEEVYGPPPGGSEK